MVIFGCGYLGSELARQALSKGFEVTALTRNAKTAELVRESGVHLVVEAELDDDSWHEKIDPEQNCVVNCVGSSGGGLDGYVKSYLDGQRSILRWAQKGRVDTFVFTSSVSVYPQTDCSFVSETSSCEGASDRGSLLLQAESIGFPSPDSMGRSFVLRLGGIYGPGRHLFLDRLRAGNRELPGNGEAFLNLIHRDDACSAIWGVLHSPSEVSGRIYNVSDGQPVRRKELVAWLSERAGLEPLEFTGKPNQAGAGFSPNRRIDNASIRKELDWNPRYSSFHEGYASLLSEA